MYPYIYTYLFIYRYLPSILSHREWRCLANGVPSEGVFVHATAVHGLASVSLKLKVNAKGLDTKTQLWFCQLILNAQCLASFHKLFDQLKVFRL